MIDARIMSHDEFERLGKFTGATDPNKKPFLSYPANGIVVQFLGNTPDDVSYTVISGGVPIEQAIGDVLRDYTLFIRKTHAPHVTDTKRI